MYRKLKKIQNNNSYNQPERKKATNTYVATAQHRAHIRQQQQQNQPKQLPTALTFKHTAPATSRKKTVTTTMTVTQRIYTRRAQLLSDDRQISILYMRKARISTISNAPTIIFNFNNTNCF